MPMDGGAREATGRRRRVVILGAGGPTLTEQAEAFVTKVGIGSES